MRSILVCAASLIMCSSPVHAKPQPPLADVTYDNTGAVPLAYGKNKKGEDAVCEYSARIGTNLKTWKCFRAVDERRAEEAAEGQHEMIIDVTNVGGGEIERGPFGLR